MSHLVQLPGVGASTGLCVEDEFIREHLVGSVQSRREAQKVNIPKTLSIYFENEPLLSKL